VCERVCVCVCCLCGSVSVCGVYVCLSMCLWGLFDFVSVGASMCLSNVLYLCVSVSVGVKTDSC
jgi:hypothetical protein